VVHIVEVADLTQYLRQVLVGDPLLADVWVRGEVAEVSLAKSGHAYFRLQSPGAQVQCVMFASDVRRHGGPPQAGALVLAHGRVDFYEARGSLQLYVDLISPEGTGELYLQIEALKLRLDREGLFAPERKRPLPRFPRRIGVVTSEGGAVLHDIITILTRRYPLAEVVLAPSSVQGDRAPEEIVAALRRLNEWEDERGRVDVIIVARGGGSLTELSAFNDERVARAIFASSIPVVSAVGHETDHTIADLVADLRAPTPSAAAEIVSPDLRAYRVSVSEIRATVASLTRLHLQRWRQQIGRCRQVLLSHAPDQSLEAARDRVRALRRRLRAAVLRQTEVHRLELVGRRRALAALNPLQTLERGYSLCYHLDTHRVVRSASEVEPGGDVEVQLHRGTLVARVLSTAIEVRQDGSGDGQLRASVSGVGEDGRDA
jgi:exodeoxyribonuclease VII large subunit